MADPTDLREVTQLIYRSWDPASSLAEYEFDHLFVGQFSGRPKPNAAEVAELRYVAIDNGLGEIETWPDVAGWLKPTLQAVLPFLGNGLETS